MIKSWICSSLLLMSIVLPCTAETRTEKMEKLISTYDASKQFMGSVLVAEGDDIILSKAYGFANLEWNIPNTPNTKFRLGSVTKQFTAVSILLLEKQGKLKTNDLIKKYFPDAPAAWDKITIFNLLNHTSGIPNFTSFREFITIQLLPSTTEKLLLIFRDKPLDFSPGEKMSYSNSGYVVLGALIEKISGKSYATFVQENIFVPLNMSDSGYDLNATIIPRRAAGYTPSDNGAVNSGYADMTVPFSAGALYSTTEDLLKWEKGLFGGKLLPVQALNKMITPYKGKYGFGVFISKVNNHTLIHHSGAIQGFNTNLTYYPKNKITIVVLANINGKASDEIADALGVIANGDDVLVLNKLLWRNQYLQ